MARFTIGILGILNACLNLNLCLDIYVIMFCPMQGKRVAVSGAGNVAIYTIEKLLELGAIPVTASDSTGYVYEEDGFTTESLEHLNDVKVVKHGSLKDYKSKTGATLNLYRLRLVDASSHKRPR